MKVELNNYLQQFQASRCTNFIYAFDLHSVSKFTMSIFARHSKANCR